MKSIFIVLYISFYAVSCFYTGQSPDNKSVTPSPEIPGSEPNPGHQGAAFSISTDAYYQANIPSPSSPGRLISLSLTPKGNASMNTDYMDKNPVVIDAGEWTTLENGNLLLNLRRASNNDSIILEFKTDGEKLIYTGSDFGTAGLTLWAKPIAPPQ